MKDFIYYGKLKQQQLDRDSLYSIHRAVIDQ